MKTRLVGSTVLVASVVSALMSFGCVHASHDQLSTRASFDLQCAPEQIQIYEIDRRTRGVRGCGHQVTYVESCDGPRDSLATSCTWVMNTQTGRIP